MKRYFITGLILLMVSNALWAQSGYCWAMAVMKQGQGKPTIIKYHSRFETAANGIEYHRIYDDSYLFTHEPYNPIKLQYGYRMADRKIFIYDFDTNEERLAFDFTLSPGDRFTTYNGMEWNVDDAKDTLVNISFCGKGDCVSKRLLKVSTVDGKQTDQWLEDFGSFTNHFMIKSMADIKYSQTLWMEYASGEYLAREINADPLFGHDSGWMDGHYKPGEQADEYARCTYDNGRVVFENVQWWWAHREYTCYYRVDDDIYRVYAEEMAPYVDGGEEELRQDIVSFAGLPVPQSGKYTIHIGNDEYTSGINQVNAPVPTENTMYDLQGRKLMSKPAKGLYIQQRKKILSR